MDLIAYNSTSDTVLVFYGDRKYTRADLIAFMPSLPSLLSGIRHLSKSKPSYVFEFNQVINYIVTTLGVELDYLGRTDSGEEASYGVLTVPNYIYAVSFVDPENLNIAVDILDLQKKRVQTPSIFINMYETDHGGVKKRLSDIFQMQLNPSGNPSTIAYADDPSQGADTIPFHLLKLASKRVDMEIDRAEEDHTISLRLLSSRKNILLINQRQAYQGLIVIIIIIAIVAIIAAVIIAAGMASSYTKAYVPDEVRNVIYQQP